MELPRIPAFYFEREPLLERARALAPGFAAAAPFPHAVLDDFLPPEVVAAVAAEFPGPEGARWLARDFDATTQTRKLSCSDETQFGPVTRHVMAQLLSHTFLTFLETLTGVPGLITDPSHHECGLHSTGPGGKLAVHTDLNRHPLRGLHQHVNLLLYLNDGWQEAYGGHLELWDRDAARAVQRILPVQNRLVVFVSGSTSFHGHPEPLACPPERRRNSLALYYYTLDRAAGPDYAGRAADVTWVATRPEEQAIARDRRFHALVRYLLPPVLLDAVRVLRGKRRAGDR